MSFIEQVEIVNLINEKKYLKEVSMWIWEEWDKKHNAKLDDIIYRTENSLNDNDIPQMYIAKYKDEAIGVVAIWRNDLKARQDLYPWMAILLVKEKYRNKGVGKKLQERCIKEVRRLNYDKLYLITDHENYYEKMGWNFLEEAPLENGQYTRIYEYKL